jgi:hypothetical protein
MIAGRVLARMRNNPGSAHVPDDMLRFTLFYGLLFGLAAVAPAQSLFSFGLKGGVPLTDAFSDHTTMGVDVFSHAYSSSKNYVIGPTVELRLPAGFAVEADALYRPLSLTEDVTALPSPPTHSATDINAWEFPILGKYHFLHTPIVKPYVEAGPIFRAVGSGAPYLSNRGLALGGGIDFKLPLVRLTPEIRYSRWAKDGSQMVAFTAPSNVNQAQFLIGISF